MVVFIQWIYKDGKLRRFQLDPSVGEFFVGRLGDSDLGYVKGIENDFAVNCGVWIFNPSKKVFHFTGVFDRSVSRRHAKLIFDGYKILIKDHGPERV